MPPRKDRRRKMTRRSGFRDSLNQSANPSDISSAYYVGYVEDSESIEAIMKKFDYVDQLMDEKKKRDENPAAVKPLESSQVSAPDASSEPDGKNCDGTGLSHEELEQVFKQTSGFSLKQAALGSFVPETQDTPLWARDDDSDGDHTAFPKGVYGVMPGDDDDEHENFKQFMEGEEQDPEYQESRDDVDDEPGTEDENKRARKPKKRKTTEGREKARETARDTMLAWSQKFHRLQELNYQIVKKRIRADDPSLPTYTRVQHPSILNRSWMRLVQTSWPSGGERVCVPGSPVPYLQVHEATYQAILLDPPWKGSNGRLPEFPIQDLYEIPFRKLLRSGGFVFIWVPKALVAQLMRIMTRHYKIRYCEHITWIRTDLSHKWIHEEYPNGFRCCKRMLMVFRLDGQHDIRHQRNPDVVIDFVKRPRPDGREGRPEYIHHVIETLIPGEGVRLLEVWGNSRDRGRRGWHQVVASV